LEKTFQGSRGARRGERADYKVSIDQMGRRKRKVATTMRRKANTGGAQVKKGKRNTPRLQERNNSSIASWKGQRWERGSLRKG